MNIWLRIVNRIHRRKQSTESDQRIQYRLIDLDDRRRMARHAARLAHNADAPFQSAAHLIDAERAEREIARLRATRRSVRR